METWWRRVRLVHWDLQVDAEARLSHMRWRPTLCLRLQTQAGSSAVQAASECKVTLVCCVVDFSISCEKNNYRWSARLYAICYMISVASDCRLTIIITACQLRQLQRPDETAHTQGVNAIVLSGGASRKNYRRACITARSYAKLDLSRWLLISLLLDMIIGLAVYAGGTRVRGLVQQPGM